MSRKKKRKTKREVSRGGQSPTARTSVFVVLGTALGLVIGYFIFLHGATLSTAESFGYIAGSLIGGSIAARTCQQTEERLRAADIKVAYETDAHPLH